MSSAIAKAELRRQKTAEQKKELKRRSNELANKEAKADLDIIFHHCPDAYPKALEYLLDLGYDPKELSERDPLVKPSKQALAGERRKESEAARKKAKQDELEAQGWDPLDLIPADKNFLLDLSVGQLKNKILSKLEAQAFSVANLNQWAKTLERGTTKATAETPIIFCFYFYSD